MAVPGIIGGLLNESGEQTVDPKPTNLTLTPKTIRLGQESEIFPIKNLTRIGRYKVLEQRFPLWLVIVLGLAGLAGLVTLTTAGIVVGLFLLVGAGFGIWNRMQPRTFAFGFETNAGSVRYLYVKDEDFVKKVVGTVAAYIESEQSSGVIINAVDRSIKNFGFIGGAASTGDAAR